MTFEREWVLLVECYSAADLQLVRATLEARGVPCTIHGEQTHGILGPIQGVVMPPRVFVPESALALARELVEDIVGPFESSVEEDEDEEGSPFRREGMSPSHEDDPSTAPAVRAKSYGVLVLVAALSVGPLLGLAHVYAGKIRRAGVLLMLSVLALVAMSRGEAWGGGVLVLVWIADLVGGAVGIAEHNRSVAALEASGTDEDEDEDEDEDAAEDAAE